MKIVREVFRNYNIFSIKVVSEDAFKEELNEAREMSRNRALPAKFEKIIDDPKALSIQIQRVASSLHEVL